jgi:outer membrane protein TolC
VAEIDRSRAASSLKRAVAETVAAVEKAYWTLVAARRDVDVRRSSVALADEQKGDAKARIDAGTLPESDIAQPTAEVERRKGELYAAEESLKRAELVLKTLMLAEESDPLWAETLVPTDAAETPIVTVDLAAALKSAGESRPEIGQGQAQVERQDVDVRAAEDRIQPQLDVVASYARRGLAGSKNPNAISFTGQPTSVPEHLDGGLGRSLGTIPENRFPDASIGLSLTIPLGNRQAKADAVIARSGKAQAAFSLAQLKQRIAVEVRNATNALQTAAQRIEAARAGREAAETQLRAEKERFGVGLSTNFFVLTRQNDLTLAQVTESAALTDYRRALTELARATGTLLETRKISIDDGGPR